MPAWSLDTLTLRFSFSLSFPAAWLQRSPE